MKSVKGENKLICYFETLLVRYGKIVPSGQYKLELILPLEKWLGYNQITIYNFKTKPKFHNLYIIGVLWFPFYLLTLVLVPFIMFIFISSAIIFSFYTHCLFQKSFITEWYEKASGYLSLVLSIIGLISIIKFFL